MKKFGLVCNGVNSKLFLHKMTDKKSNARAVTMHI